MRSLHLIAAMQLCLHLFFPWCWYTTAAAALLLVKEAHSLGSTKAIDQPFLLSIDPLGLLLHKSEPHSIFPQSLQLRASNLQLPT
jgi:hypothetical protein